MHTVSDRNVALEKRATVLNILVVLTAPGVYRISSSSFILNQAARPIKQWTDDRQEYRICVLLTHFFNF